MSLRGEGVSGRSPAAGRSPSSRFALVYLLCILAYLALIVAGVGYAVHQIGQVWP